MTLKIVVMVKQVPDTHNVTQDAMKADGTVNRAALPAIINPEDLNALEEALKIKDRIGAHITAITMGPMKAVEVLKECLYRGADEVILVSDRKFAGAESAGHPVATGRRTGPALVKFNKWLARRRRLARIWCFCAIKRADARQWPALSGF